MHFLTVPQMLFGHIYEDTDYETHFDHRGGMIETAYFTAGDAVLSYCGTEYRVGRGDIVLLPFPTDNETLDIRFKGYQRHHTVCFQAQFEYDRSDPLYPIVTHVPEGASEIPDLIDTMIRTHTLDPGRNMKCTGLFFSLLDEVAELNRRAAERFSLGEQGYIRHAKKYIYDRITQPIEQRDIAAALGITPEYLCAVFKKSEGISVIRYINSIKLMRIRALMQTEHLPLYRAAAMYGFSDPNYVSRLFRKYYGESVTESMTRSEQLYTVPKIRTGGS